MSDIIISVDIPSIFKKEENNNEESYTFPTLYGKSSKGKIKCWKAIVTKKEDNTALITITHGYEDGKKQVDNKPIIIGKNIGRANETSPFEQAISDARSTFNRKIDDQYSEDRNNIPGPDDGNFLPMLAHRFDKQGDKIVYPAATQVKLDGARALTRKRVAAGKFNGKVVMWSRKGKILDIPTKIIAQLTELLEEGQCTDGELYVHGWTFQRIISAVKKYREDTDLLEYHIYDLPHPSMSFKERFVEETKKDKYHEYDNIVIVPTIVANDLEHLNELESKAIEDGYEGLMARNLDSVYKYKHRSYDLQKVKRFLDDEFIIVGSDEGSGREAGMIVFKCITKDGKEFGVRPKGTQELRAQMWKDRDKYVGAPLTVQFFEYTDDGVPRFPVGLHIRPDWDMS